MSAGRGILDPAGTWAIIPVRGLERAKSRLGGPLDAEERVDLVSGLLRRAVAATTSSSQVAGTIVVSSDRAALDLAQGMGAIAVADLERGLNPALDVARAEALARGATAIVILPADLPLLDRDSLDDVIGAASDAWSRDNSPGTTALVAIVPDRHGTGTNALILAPPDVIEFAFGVGSRAEHAARAASAGATCVELGGPLDVDLDTADDLVLVERLAPETIDVG